MTPALPRREPGSTPSSWEDAVDRLLPGHPTAEASRRLARPAGAPPPVRGSDLHLPPEPTDRPGAAQAAHPRHRRTALHAVTTLLFMGVAAWFGWSATAPVPATTPDSIQYLTAAHNLANGRGLVSSVTDLELPATEVPFTTWPPLFSFLLALGGDAPAETIAWARSLQVGLLVASFLPLVVLAHWVAGARWAWIVLLIAACSRPWLELSSFVWSEPLFLLLVLTSIVCLTKGVAPNERGKGEVASLGWLVASGLFAALAGLTRYVGIAWIPAALVVIVARCDHVPARHVAVRFVAFLVPACLPVAAWCARNAFLTGTLFGDARSGALPALPQVILDTVRTFARDLFVPLAAGTGWVATLLGLACVLAALLLILLVVHRFGPHVMETGAAERPVAGTALVLFSLVYLVAVIASSFRLPVDPINTRLLAPIYPAAWILGVMCLRGIWDASGRPARGIACACAGVLIAANLAAGARYAFAARETRDLTYPYWRTVLWASPAEIERPELEAVRRLPEDALVVTNVWERIALHTGRAVKPLPDRSSRDWPGNLLQHGNAFVLVDPTVRPERIGIAEVEAIGPLPPGVVRIGEWNGTRLYRVRHEFDPSAWSSGPHGREPARSSP